MLRFVCTALMAVFLCLPSAAAGPSGCAKMDVVISKLSLHNAPLHRFTPDEMQAVIDTLEAKFIGKFSDATGAFIFATSSGVQVSVEIDGCLLDPIIIAKPKPERLSGKSPDGRTVA